MYPRHLAWRLRGLVSFRQGEFAPAESGCILLDAVLDHSADFASMSLVRLKDFSSCLVCAIRSGPEGPARLAALNAPDAFHLALVKVQDGFAHQPVYVSRFFQRDLGFAETAIVFNLDDLVSLSDRAT
jgi:hypothetical protein